MGNWNQIMTKMTTGGDMYQTHIRTSRNISMVLAYNGKDQGELQANRKVILDALRPDLAEGQQRIIRYQGFDENGNEATEPVDIVCVFQPSHNDTPDTPVFQKDILNFTVPSGLLQGAYNEGKELDLYVKFPADRIVKRDRLGNWCKWNGTSYDNSMKGQGTVQGLNAEVLCMAEAPDGKIYVGGKFTDAGGMTGVNYFVRWNPVTELWEAVTTVSPYLYVYALAFDANGDLYVGGSFNQWDGNFQNGYVVKITNLSGTPVINSLGTSGFSGLGVYAIAIGPDGKVYIGGDIDNSSIPGATGIAMWDGSAWHSLSNGLQNSVNSIAFAPDGNLYIGGSFLDAGYERLCKWDGTSFSAVGSSSDFDYPVWAVAVGEDGTLYVGGDFTSVGGVANTKYIAKRSGNAWSSLGTGVDNYVRSIKVISGRVYVSGNFLSAGGLKITDRVAIWSNGAWLPIDIDLPGGAVVNSVLIALDDSFYIGGNFAAIQGDANTGIVALNLNVTSASANTYPFISIMGPGTLKAITNYTTGKSVMFDGLVLQPGEWINLSFDPLDLQFRGGWEGRGNLMRYVVPGSDYGDFYLKPGTNYLSLFMTDTDANTNAWITWTPLFWGLDGALL